MKTRLVCLPLVAALCVSAQPAPQPVAVALPSAVSAADAALARPELAAYRGWLKFIRFEAEMAVARSGEDRAAR